MPTVVEIFCGAGIGAVGLKELGYDILYAVDNNPYAVSTYNANIGNHAVLGNVETLDYKTIPDSDIIIGGVPCLPFSFAGKGEGVNDKKHGNLIYEFYNIIKYKKPKYVIFENVKGIVSKNHQNVFYDFVASLYELGYITSWKLTNCLEYGIPQKRERVILVASLGDTYQFPDATHSKDEYVTIRTTIGDLPEPAINVNIKNHYGYGVRPDEAAFIDEVPIGGNWTDISIDSQKKFMGNSYYSGGGKTGYLRKIAFDSYAYTITSTMNGKFNSQLVDLSDKYQDGSVKGCRRFTVRECLRLQTVPDWYSFADVVPWSKQYEWCSGIPPLLIKKIAGALLF